MLVGAALASKAFRIATSATMSAFVRMVVLRVATHSSKFCGLLLLQTWSRLMKRPSPKARGKALRDPKPFENNKVDFSKFKTDPSTSDIARLTAGTKVWPVPPIQVLSPAKTVGLGWTSIEMHLAPFFTTNATTPYATIERPGYVAVLFQPSAYGITSIATYVITFNFETLTTIDARFHSYSLHPPAPLNYHVFKGHGFWTVQVLVRDLRQTSEGPPMLYSGN
jgi:hypothetical protein